MGLVTLKRAILGSSDESSKLLLPVHSHNGYSSIEDESMKSGISYNGVSNPRILSDIVIGLSDGLTVPFALTAGLSSLGDSKLVITGGFAELVSGALSMGLGGYLAARSENEYYNMQFLKEKEGHVASLASTQATIAESLKEFKFSNETLLSIANDIEHDEDVYARFMMKFVKGVEQPDEHREFTSAMTIGMAYFFGGFIPLIPYFFADTVQTGLQYSTVIMAITLFLFGYGKTMLSLGTDVSRHLCFSNGLFMVLTGGLAAGSAWALVRFIE